MAGQLVAEVRAYLDRLEAVQSAAAKVSARKRTALRLAEADTILRLAEIEADVAVRLRRCVLERADLLQRARPLGYGCDSIAELLDRLDADGEPVADLRPRVAAAREAAERLQREAWVHWIVASRAEAQNGRLCELIAHHGRRAPTYEGAPHDRSGHVTSGGVVLDASA